MSSYIYKYIITFDSFKATFEHTTALSKHEVVCGERKAALTDMEAALFYELADHRSKNTGKILTRSELTRNFFLHDLEKPTDDSLKTHIVNIRKKLQDNIFSPLGLPGDHAEKMFLKTKRSSRNGPEGGYYIDADVVCVFSQVIPDSLYDKHTGTIVDESSIYDEFEVQYLCGENGEKLISNISMKDNSSDDYDNEQNAFYGRIAPNARNRYSHLLIVNEGGMGKTTFLRIIGSPKVQTCFESIVHISLSGLLDHAYKNPIDDMKYAQDSINGYIFREAGLHLMNVGTGYLHLLLLDGYNELLERDDPRYHKYIMLIRNEIGIIAERYQGSISVIMTSRSTPEYPELKRFVKCSLTRITKQRVDQLLKNYTTDKLSDEIVGLLGIPLYFKYFRELADAGEKPEPGSKYELLERLHRRTCEQTYRQKNITDDFYLFVYYAAVPCLARKMELWRDTSMEEPDALALISELLSKKQYVLRLISEVTGEERSGIDLPNVPQPVLEFIRGRFEFRDTRSKNGSFSFSHQELREYFAAFSVIYDLKTLGSAYKAQALEDYRLEFNLKTSIQKTAAEVLGIDSGCENKVDNFLALFGGGEKISPSRRANDPGAAAKYLISEIRFSYAAFALDDHFMLKLLENGIVHKIIGPTALFCSNNADLVRNAGLSGEIISELCDVLSGETHYLRDHDLSECRRYIEFAEELTGIGSRRIVFEHQKAKALLKNAQNIYLGITGQKDYYGEKVPPERLFRDAMPILESCSEAGYNMSANLVCLIYSTPCMWILENGLAEISCVKAFNAVYRCFERLTEGYAPTSGTEIVYMARTLCMMLLKGYVQLDEGGLVKLNDSGELPNGYTLKYIDSVLKKTEGQTMILFNWVRGFRLLLSGESGDPVKKREAAELFMADSKPGHELFLLSMLMFYAPNSDEIRAYAECCGFDAENAYDAVLDELKKAIREKSLCTNYSFDRGDNVYYYIDIKKLLQILGSEEGRKLTLADRDKKVREAFEEIVKLVSEKDKEARENIRSFDSILSGFFPDAPSSGE